jgi:hypothetical protein
MASVDEERAAFDQLAAQLRDAAAAAARGLRASRGTPAADALDSQLEHTLDRLATLYGHGTVENLSTEDIVQAAVNNELRMATTLEEPDAAAATRRARALVDAARRGVRLHVREPAPSVRLYRGVHVTPLRPEVQSALWSREEPFMGWGDGAVFVLDEDGIGELRTAGDEVNVLFLDSDELLDLAGRGDASALQAELERRHAAAQTAPDRVGDSTDQYLLRLLDRQNIVLRNLRDRLADGHPSAHAALLPILAGHRTLYETRLAAQPAASTTAVPDPLGDAIESERGVQELAGRWAAEPGDPAGLRERFRVTAEAGSRLADLEQHRS